MEDQAVYELVTLYASCFEQSIRLVDAITWIVDLIYPRYSMERIHSEVTQLTEALDDEVRTRAERERVLRRLSKAQATFDSGIQGAQTEIVRLLNDEGLIGFGIKAPVSRASQHEPIPAVYWKALSIDWQRGCAAEGALAYFDIRVARFGLALAEELAEMPVETMTVDDNGVATFRETTEDEKQELPEGEHDWRLLPMWRLPDVARDPAPTPGNNAVPTTDVVPKQGRDVALSGPPGGTRVKRRRVRHGRPGRPEARWDLVLQLVIARFERWLEGASMTDLIAEIRDEFSARHPHEHLPAATTIRDHWPRLIADARQVQRNP